LSAPVGGEKTLTDPSIYEVTKQAPAPQPSNADAPDPKHG
jgi:hypothetical protein